MVVANATRRRKPASLSAGQPDLRHGDCREVMAALLPESVHLVVTDPPYFLDGLDADWKKGTARPRGTGIVGGLPVGMKFDPQQGRDLQAFMEEVGGLMLHALCPGSFAAVFSQPRLVHRMAVGLENAGFEIRDIPVWRFTKRAQSKAFSVQHFANGAGIPDNFKTPQLRPQHEAIVLAQKPKSGTFVENWLQYETGLMDTSARLDISTPSTVMSVEPPPMPSQALSDALDLPSLMEADLDHPPTVMTVEKPVRERYNGHLTVKPVKLIEHLICLFSRPGQVVLDPFIGSGTTAIAANKVGRKCIGIEINEDYLLIAKKRLEDGEPAKEPS